MQDPTPSLEAIQAVFTARGLGDFNKLLPVRELQARVKLGERLPDDTTTANFAELFGRISAPLG